LNYKCFTIPKAWFSGAATVRVRAVNADGASDWTYTPAMYKTYSLTGAFVNGDMNASYTGSMCFLGRLDGLGEGAATGKGWFGQSFSTPRRIKAVRAVARFTFLPRLTGVKVQVASDAAFTNTTTVATFGTPSSTNVNEIVFAEPVETRNIRILRDTAEFLDVLGLEFSDADQPETARPVLTVQENAAKTGFILAWTNPQDLDATSFNVERSVNDGAFSAIASDLSAATLTLTNTTDITAGVKYSYRVTGVSGRRFCEGVVWTSLVAEAGFVTTATWTGAGADANFATDGNWEGGLAPNLASGFVQVAVPESAIGRTAIVSGTQTVYGVTFAGTGFTFTRADANACLGVRAGGVAITGGGKYTNAVDIAVKGTQAWAFDASTVVLKGDLFGAAGQTVTVTGTNTFRATGHGRGDYKGSVTLGSSSAFKVYLDGTNIFGTAAADLSDRVTFNTVTVYLNGVSFAKRAQFNSNGGAGNGYWYSTVAATNVFKERPIVDYQRIGGSVMSGTCFVFEKGLAPGANFTFNSAPNYATLILRGEASVISQYLFFTGDTVIFESSGNSLGNLTGNANSFSTFDIRADWGYNGTDNTRYTCLNSGDRFFLNGHPARVTSLSIKSATAVVHSDAPATLYAVQSLATGGSVTYEMLGDFTGRAGFSKSGVRDTAIAKAMSSTGLVEVTEGKLVFAANGSWKNATEVRVAGTGGLVVEARTGSPFDKKVVLEVTDAGKLSLADGVSLAVDQFVFGGQTYKSGDFSKTTHPALFASDSGSGCVHISSRGTMVSIR
ncbi:MAG TPA: hypothetical protein PKI32_07320, partial [Opitutales bacterium]|nr:hypothetical protein [Opitutales bacterium]